ncbi:MAG: hypothetical protein PUC36_00670 [Clostridiales bacterium]|nr:hypothetical protein [Clostridiales bacterium]
MKKRKLIAPVIITVLVCLWLLLYLYAVFFLPEIPLWAKIVGGVSAAALCVIAVYNLVERIKEVRSGEEDDLDNY